MTTIKINFCLAKNNIRQIKRKMTNWENLWASYNTDKGPMSPIYKEVLGGKKKKIKTFESNRQNRWAENSQKEVKIILKHMKMWWNLLKRNEN